MTNEEKINIQTILANNAPSLKIAINRVEQELQVLKTAINYSVDEVVDLIKEDPRFAEKLKDSALKSPAFKKRVLQELLDFLQKRELEDDFC